MRTGAGERRVLPGRVDQSRVRVERDAHREHLVELRLADREAGGVHAQQRSLGHLKRVDAQGLADFVAHSIAQAHAVAREFTQVTLLAETERRQATRASQRREPQYFVLFAEVQVQQADAVAKGVGLGRKPPMGDPAAVQGAVHRVSPNAWATRRALTTPSS